MSQAPRIPLAIIIEEIELSCMALADAIRRARAGELRRPEPWIERRARSLAAFEAALVILRQRQQEAA